MTEIAPFGFAPQHSATVVGNKMVVVGGDSGRGLLDDTQVREAGQLFRIQAQ